MKKNNLKIVKIDKSKTLFNYEKKILINELILNLKLGYYDFEKEKPQKIKFSLEIDYQDKKPSNDKGEILYVGKAKNLPNRLKSYIAEKNHVIRTERMLSQTKNLEITTTSNESEALLLEANLIKKHKPKFNILLRDDKSFPFD